MLENLRDFIKLEFVYYFAIIAMSSIIVYVSMPTIIWTSIKHQLFDEAEMYRKVHKRNISNLGGISIFCSFTITVLLFSAMFNFQQPIIVIVSSIILFAAGLKDDIYGIGSSTKLMLSLLVAFILVFVGDFRLTSLYGVFNIGEIDLVSGGIFSIMLIIFINNAFNLIDGIDGLAGVIGVIINLVFGILFAYSNQPASSLVAFSMLGALLGFLYYNFPPAKVFMGDTGSLVVGMVSVLMAIQFIELNKLDGINKPYFFSAPAIAVAVLIIPVFDSLLIFFLRIINRKSPFKGDRNHIHHRLQRLGFSDVTVILILALVNLLTIFATFMLQNLGNFILIILQLSFIFILHCCLVYFDNKKFNKKFQLGDLLLLGRF